VPRAARLPFPTFQMRGVGASPTRAASSARCPAGLRYRAHERSAMKHPTELYCPPPRHGAQSPLALLSFWCLGDASKCSKMTSLAPQQVATAPFRASTSDANIVGFCPALTCLPSITWPASRILTMGLHGQTSGHLQNRRALAKWSGAGTRNESPCKRCRYCTAGAGASGPPPLMRLPARVRVRSI
jgi:hypothetical protein